MSHIRIAFLLFVLYMTISDVRTQYAESCKTDFGTDGLCLLLPECRSAIDLILERGHPKLCGFDKLIPIVCCHINQSVLSKFGEYGSIAKEKCSQYVSSAAAATIRATTTIAPELKSIREGTVPIILGGVDAIPTEFPHMAILGYGDETDIQWKCGGSLISEQFVLTAAHCIHSRFGKVAFVNLGLHDINQKFSGIQKFTVKNTYLYPEYIPNKRYHDIALIELNSQAKIRAGVKPACLQTEKEIEKNILTATGWGDIEYAGRRSNVLQKVNLTKIPFEVCARFYKPETRLEKGLVDDVHLCAGSPLSREDTCEGDSGGPLQFKIDGSKLFTIVGVTSFGLKCGLLPSVYTRVSYYVPWIEGIVWPDDVYRTYSASSNN